MKGRNQVDRIARALGASRVVPLGKVEHTPIGMLALTERVRKLRSSGPGGTGRPSDPEATLPRIIKFKSKIWKKLRRVAADQAQLTGRQVSPAQIASMLIEEALKGKKRGARRRAQ
jgi:hypothetical protein